MEQAESTARELHDAGHGGIDAAVAERARHGGSDRVAEQVPGERDRVDAQVEERAAGQVDAPVASVGIEDGQAEVGLDQERIADLAVEDALADVLHRRDEPGPHGLHEEAVVPAGGLDHLACLCRVDRERLLAQHVPARVERGDRHGVVVAVGEAM